MFSTKLIMVRIKLIQAGPVFQFLKMAHQPLHNLYQMDQQSPGSTEHHSLMVRFQEVIQL